MKILLLGSGGREHAFAWKMSQSPDCSELFIAPGNAGTDACGANVAINPNDFEAVKKFCINKQIDMVVVGPEEPLVLGIVDFFKNDEELKNTPIVGPSAEGAQLEGSKAYAKKFMQEFNIPTAAYREFSKNELSEGLDYIARHPLPVVLKADGLAAGKGVVICENAAEAQAEFKSMLSGKFGAAGDKVVVEQFLSGIEFSVFVLTDGKSYKILPVAKDYKRIGEGDTGLNTGGMGAVSPPPFVDKNLMQKVENQIIKPTVAGLDKKGIAYKGFIFFGLIKVGEEPFVIEYNCRMGDPETEVVLPRLDNDLVALFSALMSGKLAEVEIFENPNAAATVMLVSGDYPGDYEKGKPIGGLEMVENSLVFHAGTQFSEKGLTTNSGRVLAITSLGADFREALKISNRNAALIRFDGKYFRRDIGFDL
ncbi:MAG TPA: phosphoribosylamine--glycine ligase [Saprospiraceae bacterium]|nr:phosphoribosylamine--glycine ligase [Saprospiraceae bacterium]